MAETLCSGSLRTPKLDGRKRVTASLEPQPTPTPVVTQHVHPREIELQIHEIGFSTLPNEVLRNIFSYLSANDVCRLAQVCVSFRDVASHPSLCQSIKLKPTHSQKGKTTLHQILRRFPHLHEIELEAGFHLNKAVCRRIARDAARLKRFVFHLVVRNFYTMNQELSNVASCFPCLTSVVVRFAELNFTTEGLLFALQSLTSLKRLHLLQIKETPYVRCSPSHLHAIDSSRRIDVDLLLSKLSLRLPLLADLRIDFNSYRDVRRVSVEGLKPLSQSHTSLTHFHLKHCLMSSICLPLLHRFQNLTHVGLVAVEGLLPSDWRSLFVKPHFSALESVEMDFVSQACLNDVASSYGLQLQTLVLHEYTLLFTDAVLDSDSNPDAFFETLFRFKVLTHFNLVVKAKCLNPQLKKIVSWILTTPGTKTFPCPVRIERAGSRLEVGGCASRQMERDDCYEI